MWWVISEVRFRVVQQQAARIPEEPGARGTKQCRGHVDEHVDGVTHGVGPCVNVWSGS